MKKKSSGGESGGPLKYKRLPKGANFELNILKTNKFTTFKVKVKVKLSGSSFIILEH